MTAIFIGSGHLLKDNDMDFVNNTEVYNIMCKLLGLKSAANNGTYPFIDLVHAQRLIENK